MNVETLDFSTEQQSVVDEVLDWRRQEPRGDAQFLTLGGLAGTGKTTIIAYLARVLVMVAVAAFCGKAAHVLRSKGVDATTIHRLIYFPQKLRNGRIRFRKRRFLDCVQTIIIDEASMIDHVLCADLLSFGLPVLFVGDHGQLEPIGTNANLMANPMLRLETIHRQTEGNPILRLATAFREGRRTPRWNDPKGRLTLVGRHEFNKFISPDIQIICGFNSTRHKVNAQVRQNLGHGNELIVPGEKLICLKNNYDWGIFNGQQVTVLEIAQENRTTIELDIETDDGRTLTLPVLRQQFGNQPVKDFRSKEVALMDYGYCLTAHKAQGAEWDAVLVLEEIGREWDARRWRYTAATRAKQRLIYCQ